MNIFRLEGCLAKPVSLIRIVNILKIAGEAK
jgi:hypothetical protein